MLAKVCLLAALGLAGVYVAFPRPVDRSLVLDQPVAVVKARLERQRRDVDGTGMGGLTLDHAGTDGDVVRIAVTRAGDPHGVTCRVALAQADPARTAATVDCAQPVAGAQTGIRRIGEQAIGLIVREHVAATVADRDYDIGQVSGGLVTLVATNKPAIAESIEADAARD